MGFFPIGEHIFLISDLFMDIESAIWNYFFPLLVGSRLMSCNIVNYLIFLTGKILFDLMDNILMGIILFPLSMGFDLQNMGFLDYP